ncbi:hypothetical protein B0H11DRAFT_1664118, partial [Mycena galericulata]
YFDTNDHKEPVRPHILKLAHDVYVHRKRRAARLKTDASSRPTELSLSNPGKKGSKVATQVLASKLVLESFGNVRS